MGSRRGLTWRPRWWDSSWFVAGAGLIAALAGTIDKWPVPSWVFLAVSVTAVALGTAVLAIKTHQGVRETQRGLTEAAARSLTRGGGLPLVKDVKPVDFGVNPARVSVGYLDRQVQDALLRELSRPAPTLLLGDSLAGKTRVAVEMLSRRYADWHVWLPQVPAGPQAFFANQEATLERTVLFLDELQRFLAPGQEFHADWLERLTSSGNQVIATMRSSEYETFLPHGEFKHEHWDVLQRFEKIWLVEEGTEREELAVQITDPRIREGVARYGLGQYIGGADIAMDRVLVGEVRHKLGIAMLRAAADWQRIGRGVIPRETLASLAPAYLRDMDRDDPGEDEATALNWATGRAGPIRLLEPSGAASYRVMDYLQDHLERTGGSVPGATWDAAIAIADDDQDFEVSSRAYRLERPDITRLLLTRQASRDPRAGITLGVLLSEQGDLEAAQKALRDVMARFDEPWHSGAKYFLVREVLPDDDPEGIALLTEVLEAGIAIHVPAAAYVLGHLLEEAARFTEAADAYRKAVDAGGDLRHLTKADLVDAYVGLGRVLKREGDRGGARAAWEQAIALDDSDDQDRAQEARLRLGGLMISDGDREAGEGMLRELMATGSPYRALEADQRLGVMFFDEGNFGEAEASFRRGLASEFPDRVAEAERNLASVYIRQGDRERARRALREVIGRGDPRYTATAENNLGALLMDDGDFDAAGALFESAARADDPDDAATAERNLAALYYRAGDMERAKSAARRVIKTGDPRYTAEAENYLGRILKDDGDFDEASAHFRSALSSADNVAAERAELLLAEVSMDRGDTDKAEDAYRTIIVRGGAGHARAVAYSQLGSLLIEAGRTAEAEQLITEAASSGNENAAALGKVLRGYLLMRQGNPDEALAVFTEAVGSGFSDAAGLAYNNIGVIMMRRDDYAAAEEAYREAIATKDATASRLARQNLNRLLEVMSQPPGKPAAGEAAPPA